MGGGLGGLLRRSKGEKEKQADRQTEKERKIEVEK